MLLSEEMPEYRTELALKIGEYCRCLCPVLLFVLKGRDAFTELFSGYIAVDLPVPDGQQGISVS